MARKTTPTTLSSSEAIAKKALYDAQRYATPKPNRYNNAILDQLYITRANYVHHFNARSISLLGYNPYANGVYSFENDNDERRFMYYWCCGHGIEHGKQYHAALATTPPSIGMVPIQDTLPS